MCKPIFSESKDKNITSTSTNITLSNIFLQLAGAISAICGFIVINFLLAVYVSVKRMGGNLEKRHVYVISSVALLFLFGGAVLSFLGSLTV